MNRRIFLERFGLLATGMVVSLKSNAFNKLAHGNTITGKVTDGKNPIANVVLARQRNFDSKRDCELA